MKKILYICFFWIVVIILTLLPLSLARIGIDLYFLPQIEIAITFFLSIYTNVYPIQLFLYGLLVDVAYGPQIGVSAFILLLINKIISGFKSNLAGQDMITLLRYFAITYILIAIFKYIVFSFEAGLYIDHYIKYTVINIIVNIIFYPVIHFMMLYSPYFHSSQAKL